MKTIEAPKPLRVYHLRCNVEYCNALIECSKEELKYDGDWRDGYAYILTCPYCKKDTWFSSIMQYVRTPS